MDHQAFDYSMKNIPIPSREFYLKCLIEKTELVIKRLKWKALITEKEKCNLCLTEKNRIVMSPLNLLVKRRELV